MPLVLSKPVQGGLGSVLGYPSTYTVPPNTQTILVQSSGISAKWIVTITDQPNTKAQAFEILAVKVGTTVSYNSYGIVGDSLNFTLEVSIQSGLITISVINHESFDFVINIANIKTT
jgi:hypothetical protein